MLDPQLAQIDTDLLIQTIKERPCLYARDSSKYSDANYKNIMWENVASILFSDVWEKCNDNEKAEKVELVQRRWRNLRACFRRELTRQSDPKWVYGVSYKRRKYIYYNDLLFLRSEVDISDDDTSQDIDLPVKTDDDNTKVKVDTNIEEIPIAEIRPVPKPNKIEKVEALTPEPIEISTKHEPDSTNFALSLVPMLDMLPVYKRIDAQISILSIIKKFLQNADDDDDMDKEVEVRKEKKKSDYTRKRKVNETNVCVEIKSEAGSDVEDVSSFL
ncbi:uncharacterized protein LOC111364786 [Spodoptera litura]|uniref:Uncharacterized protein LOC111364786 n=1 Tax=Spodoptera litura TaxID=69820 RepID=A0A9J7ES76_SPOLT|nr:uncharacterized protein LOC111364786 [Spodoptera litura]